MSIRGMNANIAFGRVPGHKTTSADAVKAYVQVLLNTKHPTWGTVGISGEALLESHVGHWESQVRNWGSGISCGTLWESQVRHCGNFR